MGFRIELLNGFKLTDDETCIEIPLRSYSGIAAVLAFSDAPVTRPEIIAYVWPDADHKTGLNRLRVALNSLRKAVPSLIQESSEGLFLNPLLAESDIADIRTEVRLSENTVTEQSELDHLLRAVRAIGEAGNIGEWGSIADGFWSFAASVCLRTAELAMRLGSLDDALEAASLGIKIDGRSPGLWAIYLRVSWQMGNGESALVELQGKGGAPVIKDPAVKEVIAQIRLGEPSSGNIFSSLERQMIVELFEAVTSSRPELCRAIVSSPQALPLSGKFPKQMHDIISRIVDDPAEKDENWERCMARMIGLKAWLNDAEGVLENAPRVLESSQSPVVLRAAWNAVSVAHSLVRNWPEAMNALDKTLEFAGQTGEEIDVLSTRGNRAFYLMQQGLYDESEAEYAEILERLKEIGSTRAMFEYAVGIGSRAFIPLFRQDWPAARQRLEEAIAVRSSGRDAVQMGLLQTGLGLVKMQEGETDGVVSLIRAGFLDAFTSGSVRNQQITFELAAGALACTSSRGYATAVIEWVNAWRERTGLPRGKAEVDFCSMVQGAASKHKIKPSEQPSDIGLKLMRLLRAEIG